jgi:hypothetical protein
MNDSESDSKPRKRFSTMVKKHALLLDAQCKKRNGYTNDANKTNAGLDENGA